MVFEQITKKVTQMFYEHCRARNGSIEADQQYSLFFEHQKYFAHDCESSHKLSQVYEQIGIEYGAVFKRSLQEEAARVKHVLSQIPTTVIASNRQA